MKSARRLVLSGLLGLCLSLGACKSTSSSSLNPTRLAPDASPEALARLHTEALSRVEVLSRQLERLRGLRFKRPVKVEVQTLSAFQKYVNQQLDKALSSECSAAVAHAPGAGIGAGGL